MINHVDVVSMHLVLNMMDGCGDIVVMMMMMMMGMGMVMMVCCCTKCGERRGSSDTAV